MGKDETTVEQALENALDHVDDEEGQYWIRTALQHLQADKEGAEEESSD